MWKCKDCNEEFGMPYIINEHEVCRNFHCRGSNIIEIKNENQIKSLRYNKSKPKWSQIHYKSLEPMIRVLEYGESKYNKKNWQVGLDLVEIQESMQRHLAAVMDGELYDKESGELHIGHIMSNCMFWVYHFNKNKENNNE